MSRPQESRSERVDLRMTQTAKRTLMEAFTTALDTPPASNPKLAALLAGKPAWEL